MSRKTLDELQEFVKRYGASALAWIKLGDEVSSSLLKALGNDQIWFRVLVGFDVIFTLLALALVEIVLVG